jgi:hypothetical protein
MRIRFPGGVRTPIDSATVDWAAALEACEIVIVEINESMIAEAGFGFVDAALAALRRQAPEKTGERNGLADVGQAADP